MHRGEGLRANGRLYTSFDVLSDRKATARPEAGTHRQRAGPIVPIVVVDELRAVLRESNRETLHVQPCSRFVLVLQSREFNFTTDDHHAFARSELCYR